MSLCEPCESSIVPLPWREIPPSTEPLTAVRYHDTMHTVLEQCWGLAEVCAVAATEPCGPPNGLPHALAVLEEYTACALALYERWHATGHAPPSPQGDPVEGDAPHEA
jgi:hypothetical protein